jgi:hypothetical protein
MTWTDRNGRNLLVASVATWITTDGSGTELRSATIRVVHVAGVGTAHPVALLSNGRKFVLRGTG